MLCVAKRLEAFTAESGSLAAKCEQIAEECGPFANGYLLVGAAAVTHDKAFDGYVVPCLFSL